MSLEAIVLALHYYTTFDALFTNVPRAKFGDLTHKELIAQVRQFYSPENEQTYGVVGIEFAVKISLS